MPTHPWKARLIVGFIMLALAFFGVVMTDIQTTGGWNYWKWIVPIFAILSLWLSWYVKRQKQIVSPIKIWHELLHWLGLILAIFLVSYLADIGTISRFVAGIFHLILLSLTVFIAGIYIETIFIFVGIVLGIFALLTAVFIQYLYAIAIPVIIGAVIVIVLSVWLSHRSFNKK